MPYDYDRPFVQSTQLLTYTAIDAEESRLYGAQVRAISMSNAEYATRYHKLSADRTMKPPPSHNRIFPGYLVVRKIDTKNEYETWMPDHVFDELYSGPSPSAK